MNFPAFNWMLDFYWIMIAKRHFTPPGQIPGSILSTGYCLCGVSMHVPPVGSLWVLQFPCASCKNMPLWRLLVLNYP